MSLLSSTLCSSISPFSLRTFRGKSSRSISVIGHQGILFAECFHACGLKWHGLSKYCQQFHSSSRTHVGSAASNAFFKEYKSSFNFGEATHRITSLTEKDIGRTVVLHGYFGTRSDISKYVSFVPLHNESLEHQIQVVSLARPEDGKSLDAHTQLRAQRSHTPVTVRGVVKRKQMPNELGNLHSKNSQPQQVFETLELKLDRLWVFNTFPKDINLEASTNVPAEHRHLQIRNSRELRQSLRFRAQVAAALRKYLGDGRGFVEIETPLLFKSTPEGAREFLVPTRTKGFAYALPQSPQQYKQILMASGFSKYFQLAKCFRDEDLRADRQPEFTQFDLEMSFTNGRGVMDLVEKMIRMLWVSCLSEKPPLAREPFPKITYESAMKNYGSDKPDIRLGMELLDISQGLPVDLISKLGPLTSPVVEAFKFSIAEDLELVRRFIFDFMDSADAAPFLKNPDGQPGIFFIDSSKPLVGLQPFGFEAAKSLHDRFEMKDGDVIVVQARENKVLNGSSTSIGNLRLALHRVAVAKGLTPKPEGFSFVWVTEFPLFTSTNAVNPGQGGTAGISSMHHPFSAPASTKDIDLLATDPLQVKADHYDLVVNGIELGGGSRRIHDAKVQEYVLREVLKVGEERMADFAHMLEILRAGCPPHAGFALGFDRLVAVMLEKPSIRDVIAFPKSGRGEDHLVKSPSLMTTEQLDTYHLRLKE